MADNEEGQENISRGNEWEVVSLTASAYAAAPGPQNVEPKNDDKGDANEEIEVEISRALFMSGHFVFPPSEHENLPLEPEPSETEISNEPVGKDVVSEVVGEEGGRSSGKDDDDENLTLKKLSVHSEFPGIQFFVEKSNRLSIHAKEFEEGTTLQGLNLSDKEGSICSAATFGSFHSEGAFGGSTTYDENMAISEPIETSEQGLDLPAGALKGQKEDDKLAASNLPCEAWWKRTATSLYSHAKEANAFWSIFIAATVMGLVLIGQRWQQERWQGLQLKWQFSIKDEKAGRMLAPISRLKDAIVGGHRRGSFIRGSSSSNDN